MLNFGSVGYSGSLINRFKHVFGKVQSFLDPETQATIANLRPQPDLPNNLKVEAHRLQRDHIIEYSGQIFKGGGLKAKAYCFVQTPLP